MKRNKVQFAIYLTILLLFIVQFSFMACKKKSDDPCVEKTWFEDKDGDGFGVASVNKKACEKPVGFVDNSDDCDDNNANIHKGAIEIFGNGIDEDCDGLDTKVWYNDIDKDGFGNPADRKFANTAPLGYVQDSSDCNDLNASINPGATEIPDNGIDEDCDGSDSKIWFKDEDGDGFGNPSISKVSAIKPDGYVNNNSDCDDQNQNVNPSATDIPNNGIDENCDGFDIKRWFRDADGDGFGDASMVQIANVAPSGFVENGSDCDDSDNKRFPGANEICDTIDNDCDGMIDEDTNKNTDPLNCGDCGIQCPSGMTCDAGVCK
jgi:hypothetical protein